MGRGLINKYIWILDTVQRYGRITRSELNDLWIKSDISNGEKLVRRTFYNYREGIAEIFNVDIECDPSTFEYYIKDSGVDYWIYGHSHYNADVKIGNTKCISNQLGYVFHGEHETFNPCKFIKAD